MKYSEIIRELNYWKEVSGEEDPEVVVYSTEYEESIEIEIIEPCEGIDEDRAIGITIYS